MAALRLLVPMAALALLPRFPAGADYQIQVIARTGDNASGLPIDVDRPGVTTGQGTPAPNLFIVGGLNDRDQLLFGTGANGSPTLFQYIGGRFMPISHLADLWASGRQNQSGAVVFDFGTLALWDDRTQQVSPVALAGMPALDYSYPPAINNQNEIAFDVLLTDAAGQPQRGVLFRDRNRKLLPIALPGQELPEGGKIAGAFSPSVNDAGAVAFLARPRNEEPVSAYLWEQGSLRLVAKAGTQVSGGKIKTVTRVWENNQNRTLLVAAQLQGVGDASAPWTDALYRSVDGQLVPVVTLPQTRWQNGIPTLVAPGQSMPGGGRLAGLPDPRGAVSDANERGELAFLAWTDEGTGIYRLAADGTLSLILKRGTMTAAGQVTGFGGDGPGADGIALNSQGEVAVTVKLNEPFQGIADTLALLRPTAP